MSDPRPIGDVAPPGGGEQTEFTSKDQLEGIILTITDARHIPKGVHGPFWAIDAIRQDTGEHVALTGSTAINGQMQQCKDKAAFPVVAILKKVQPEDGNWYWLLDNPPGVESKPTDRVAEVQELIREHQLGADDVVSECDAIRKDARVNDLTDDEYGKLLSRLIERAERNKAATEEPPF